MKFIRVLLISIAAFSSTPTWCDGGTLERAEPFQAFEVQEMELIVQDKKNACWFASAMMLLSWKERFQPGYAKICSTIDRETVDLYKANNGLDNDQIIPLANRLGLVAVPPMSPSADAIRDWLKQYGPLWTNGKTHIVVIAGIRRNHTGEYEVKVYDPWPGNGVSWRTLAGWYTGRDPGKNAASSRDIKPAVEAVFLHAP